jgi:iron complex outermembrane receptor protein
LQIGTSSLAGSVGSGSGGVALFSANALPSSHKAELAFYSDADQMQNYHTGISLKGNIKKINYNFKYYQTSESNEFTFKDPWKEDNLEWQHHNNHRSRHLLLEMGHKRKKSEFKLASWLSGRTLNLPNQLGFYGQSDANQADSAMRIVGSYQLSLGNWKLFSSISRFSEIQMYRSHKLSEGNYFVDSRHKSINNSINVLLKNENKKFLKEIQIQPFLTSVHSNDYVSGSQSEMGFFSAIRYRLRYNRFASGIQLRQEFSNLAKPITALSFVQNIRTNKILGFISEFEMSISSMHRRPTLNERFWTPVINQTIKPENGWQSGVCWKLNKVSEKHSINIASTINFFELRDKIVWVNENAIWFARNVYYAKGFNWSLNVEHERKIKNVILTTGLRLTKTSAKYAIADEWIRAPYTPEWSAALNLMVHYKNWSIAGSTGYSSAQTVDFTDSPWASIPDQFRQDIRLNCQVLKSQNKVELFLAVDNISDERYQSVYAMPMPGRICRLGVSLRHNHK